MLNLFFYSFPEKCPGLTMSLAPLQTNENFIKACRDGDLESYNQLVVQADINYVSESGG